MQETLCNLAIVTIVGNLLAIAAIPVAGIFWFMFGDYIRREWCDSLDRMNRADAPTREYPRE